MTRAYLRFDPKWFERKVVEDHYPNGAAVAFMATFCLCESQPERGRFRTERLLRLLLDEPVDGARTGLGKWVTYLVDHGDLTRLADGRLYMDGWDEWQEGDVTVPERMSRLRARRRDGVSADPVTPTVTPLVTAPEVTVPSERKAVGNKPLAVSESISRAPNGELSERERIGDAMRDASGLHFPMPSRNGDRLELMAKRDGIDRLIETIRQAAEDMGSYPDQSALVNTVANYLNPSLSGKRETPAEKAEREMRERVAKLNAEAAARRAPQGVA